MVSAEDRAEISAQGGARLQACGEVTELALTLRLAVLQRQYPELPPDEVRQLLNRELREKRTP